MHDDSLANVERPAGAPAAPPGPPSARDWRPLLALLAWCCACLAIRLAEHGTLERDEAEIVYLTQQLRLGYGTQPPRRPGRDRLAGAVSPARLGSAAHPDPFGPDDRPRLRHPVALFRPAAAADAGAPYRLWGAMRARAADQVQLWRVPGRPAGARAPRGAMEAQGLGGGAAGRPAGLAARRLDGRASRAGLRRHLAQDAGRRRGRALAGAGGAGRRGCAGSARLLRGVACAGLGGGVLAPARAVARPPALRPERAGQPLLRLPVWRLRGAAGGARADGGGRHDQGTLDDPAAVFAAAGPVRDVSGAGQGGDPCGHPAYCHGGRAGPAASAAGAYLAGPGLRQDHDAPRW